MFNSIQVACNVLQYFDLNGAYFSQINSFFSSINQHWYLILPFRLPTHKNSRLIWCEVNFVGNKTTTHIYIHLKKTLFDKIRPIQNFVITVIRGHLTQHIFFLCYLQGVSRKWSQHSIFEIPCFFLFFLVKHMYYGGKK